MTGVFNRFFLGLFSFLFLAAAAAASFFHEPLILAAPLALIGILVMVQYPQGFFYVLLASIPWSVEYNFSPGLGTDLPDEPLMLLTAFSILAIVIHNRKKISVKEMHPLFFLIFLQLAWSAATVITSTYGLISLKFLLAKCWYLLAFVAMPFFLFRERINLKTAALVLFSSMMLFMFVAIARHANNGWTFAKINDSLLPFFRNHVNYSAMLVCMIPVQLAIRQSASSRWLKYLMNMLLVVTLGALYFSYARGAWLALITGVVAFWLIRKRMLFAAVVLSFVISIAAVFWLKHNDYYLNYAHDYKTTIFHKDFKDHLVATYKLKDVSTAERFYRWIAGVRLVKDHWQTGIGPNTFYRNYKSYAVPAFKTWVSRNEEQSTVHNYFLLVLIEQGLIGFILLMIFIAALFWYIQKIYGRTGDKFWKTTLATVGSILVMVITVNFLSDLIETDKVGSIFYLCVTTVVIADLATRAKKERPSS